MSITLRIFLILGALAFMFLITKRIKNSKARMDDAVFWVVLALVIVLLALFPQIAIGLAALLGVQSATNFVFLLFFGLLLFKVFVDGAELATLRAKVERLSQKIGLDDHDARERRTTR